MSWLRNLCLPAGPTWFWVHLRGTRQCPDHGTPTYAKASGDHTCFRCSFWCQGRPRWQNHSLIPKWRGLLLSVRFKQSYPRRARRGQSWVPPFYLMVFLHFLKKFGRWALYVHVGLLWGDSLKCSEIQHRNGRSGLEIAGCSSQNKVRQTWDMECSPRRKERCHHS